jgi:PII-like signaling protein
VSGREGLELRFHFGERDRDGDGPLESAVMDACERGGVWAAALLRGVEGFGRNARERTDRLLSLSEDAPLVAVAVGGVGDLEALAEEVRAVAPEGLLTLESVGLAPTGSAAPSAAVVAEPVGGAPEDVVRATIWGARSGARSPHLRAVDALYRHGAESATVLLGVDGVLDGERRRARFVAGNQGVPAMTVAVGERGAILAAVAELGAAAGLVTFEGVERNRSNEAERLHGTRVTLLTSEATPCADGPLYLEFVHALRRAGAPGATALRGVWGFRGEVAPHGDRVLALRRDVPVLVETVDAVEPASRWLEIAESLAGNADFVHSQAVGRMFALQ